jgi:hypothetical protein
MKKRILLPLMAYLLLITGCNAASIDPTYGELSVEGFNYTPYNLSRFVISDEYGNTAGGGGDLPPGAGEGRLSCCYFLKGTEFTVKWAVYDADEAMKDIYAPIKKIYKTTKIHLPPTQLEGETGQHILGLHFYPDDHIEFEFMHGLGGSRVDYPDVDYLLNERYGKRLNPEDLNEWVIFRRTARIAGVGLTKYGLTNSQDLVQYVYYTLLVNPKFDEHPAIQKILRDTKGQPGAFGAAMDHLPASLVKQLKNNQFRHIKLGANHA